MTAMAGRFESRRAVAVRSFTIGVMEGATRTAPGRGTGSDVTELEEAGHSPCCGLYHRAVELVGKRWTGAILLVMLDGPLRFSEIRVLVPDISDRLLSERLKELEGEGIVDRSSEGCAQGRVRYRLTDKGEALEPAVGALKTWAHSYL
jgi:DNA-binding HxlR family transcriptional regulator